MENVTERESALLTAWRMVKLARLHFVGAGFLVFAAGALLAFLAGAPLNWTRLIFGYLAFLPAHAASDFSNEYYDLEVDRLAQRTMFAGGSGVLVAHPELRPLTRTIGLLLIAASLVLAVAFYIVYDYPVWFLAWMLAGNALSWFYAAPPIRLAYRGLGEAATALTMGVMIPGMGYLVAAGNLRSPFALFAIPFTLFGLAQIINIQIPDEEADRQGGKRTLVSRIGRRGGFVVAGVSLLLATAYYFAWPAVASSGFPADLRMLGLFSLVPLVPGLAGMMWRPQKRALAAHFVALFMFALAAFVALVDVYFLYLYV